MLVFTGASKDDDKVYSATVFGRRVFDHNLPVRASAISIPLTLKFFVSSDQRKFVIW